MIELLNSYLNIFLHPFSIHKELRQERLEKKVVSENVILFPGIEEEQQDKTNFFDMFTREEGVAISWIFALIMAMYELFALNLSLISYDYFNQDATFANFLLESYSRGTHTIFLFMTIVNVIFFPISAWLYLKFWEVVIRFFALVFDADDDFEDVIEQILTCSLSSYILLAIPIFGTIAHYTANLIYLYAGLKNNMGLTTLQSIIVLVSPLFLMLLVVFLMIFSLVSMFSAL